MAYSVSLDTIKDSLTDGVYKLVSTEAFSSNKENVTSVEISMSDCTRPTPEENPEQKFRKMYFAALAALLNAISTGFAINYTATALHSMKQDPNGALVPNEDEEGWIGSLLAVGALIGGLIAGKLAQSAGRRRVMIASSILFMPGWIIIAAAPSIPYLYAGRLITGLCCGLVSATAPTYLVEISTPEIRGFLGSSYYLFLEIGGLTTSCFGYFMHWSYLAGLGCILSTVTLLAMLFVPESPYWLMTKEKTPDAKEAIQWLQGSVVDAAEQCKFIQEDINNQPQRAFSFKEFSTPEAYKPAFLSLALMFFQRASGVNIIFFYQVDILNEAGSSISGNITTIIVILLGTFTALLSTILTDKIGRKPLLLISGGFMALSWCSFGIFEYFAWMNGSYIRASYGWLPVVCLVLFMVAFSIGFGPIPWLMVGEMATVRLRSVTSGGATAINWVCVFAITKTFRDLTSAIHTFGAYWFYMAICIAGCFFTFLLPETKGKTFEEIQESFAGKKVALSNSNVCSAASILETQISSNEIKFVKIEDT